MPAPYNESATDLLISQAHEVYARLEEIESGRYRASIAGEGQLYCVTCERWATEPTKVIANARLCSCGTEFLEITPF